MRNANPGPATCHPAKPAFARGLCSACYSRDRRLADPERVKANGRKYWQRNRERLGPRRNARRAEPEMRERVRTQSRDSNRRYPDRNRDRHLRREFGIGLADYAARLAAQGGRCAICRSDDPRTWNGGKSFAVDHDHATGKVRGLLCRHCNLALGYLRDNPELAEALAAYLRR